MTLTRTRAEIGDVVLTYSTRGVAQAVIIDTERVIDAQGRTYPAYYTLITTDYSIIPYMIERMLTGM